MNISFIAKMAGKWKCPASNDISILQDEHMFPCLSNFWPNSSTTTLNCFLRSALMTRLSGSGSYRFFQSLKRMQCTNCTFAVTYQFSFHLDYQNTFATFFIDAYITKLQSPICHEQHVVMQWLSMLLPRILQHPQRVCTCRRVKACQIGLCLRI